jgi:formylglycine-generating enzyme required for sulfatase activity
MLASKPGWSPPDTFDEYRLLRLLGRGGMGQVYLAEDTLLERRVAVKFIASIRPDAHARQRFQVEARALARLSHPNVVAVHRVGELDGRPFLITEFVQGRTLAELPRPVPVEQVLRIARGLTRGLAAAHRQSVLHRDLKPANVMLAEDEEVKLLDFGVAKLLAHTASLLPEDGAGPSSSPLAGRPDASGILGTPLYMAPEVLLGEPSTHRSDLYSLGAVLYELCCGEAPRQALSQALPFEEWVAAEPPPLGTRMEGLEPRLSAAITRCLRQAPEHRFASAEELYGVLEAIGPERAAGEVPEGNPYRGLRPFEAEHRTLFFGRSAEREALLERLRTESLLVVAGDSGVGKSSLCRAGVLPRVAEGALGQGRSWRILSLVPGRRPLQALASHLAAAFEREEDVLLERLREDARGLCRELPHVRDRSLGLLLFVDQVEELFTLASPQEAALFGEVVACLAACPGTRVLLAVRGDFFTRLGSLQGLAEEVSRALYLLPALSPEGMRAAILGPARQKGVGFESEALVDVLVESSRRAAGGLPLLQFAMAELWEVRDEARRLIPASALEALGGVAGALARHADGVLASLLPEPRRAARRLFLQLVTVEGTGARRTREELSAEEPAASAALDALVRGRLLVAREVEGETAYEVAHEALLREWGTLRHWLDTEGVRRQVRERLESAAAEWSRLGHSQEALWSERQLVEAVAVDSEVLSPRGAQFLAASHGASRRVRWRRRVLLALVPLAVGLALSGLRFKAQRDLAAVVKSHETRAGEFLNQGRSKKAEAELLRGRAFLLFDEAGGETVELAASRREAADQVWAEALAAFWQADTALARAGQAFEAALALDLSDSRIRGRVGDVLVERAELAEWFHQGERRADLAQRLTSYDDGERQRWLVVAPRLSLHTSPPGAEVVLERYEEDQGYLKPVRVGVLGRTPLEDVEVPGGPGSYRLTFQAPSRATVRHPLLLTRGERLRLDLDLPAASSIPEGFVYVPPGRFLYGSADPEGMRRGIMNAPPLHELRTGAFLIARTEVTFREWIEFLEALPLAERARRLPTASMRQWGMDLERLPDRVWRLTLLLNGKRLSARQGEPLLFTGRTQRHTQDWLQLSAVGLSFEDAQAYVKWLRDTGRVPGARLCNEHEWERAARGADGRAYPHGNRLEPEDANFDRTYGRKTYAYGPDEVGSHPASTSPFDLLDMTGNVYEMVHSQWKPEEVVIRGGSWYYDSISVLAANRTVVEPQTRDMGTGLRVCAEAPAPQG